MLLSFFTKSIQKIKRYGRFPLILFIALSLFVMPLQAYAFSEGFGAIFGIAGGVAATKLGLCGGVALVTGGLGGVGCAITIGVAGLASGLLGGQFGDWITGKVLDGFFVIITTIAQWIVGIFINFSAMLLEASIRFNTLRISDFAPVVKAHALTTQLANMFLIALLIIVALATILQIESYGVRKVLPALLVLAIVVNFSTLFLGIVVDAGNTVFNFLWHNSNLSGISLNEYIIRNMKISEFVSGSSEGVKAMLVNTDVANTGPAAVEGALSVLIIIIGFYAGYVFLRLAILMFMRIGVFWFLIMVAPVIFIFGALPQGRGYLKEWFTQILKWSFLGPVVFFFLFFGLLMWTSLNAFMLNVPVGGTGGNAKLTSLSMLYITPMVLFFFTYALKVSKQMAGAAANAVVDSVISIGKGIALGTAAFAGGAAIAGGGRWLLRQKPVKDIAERLQRSSGSAQRTLGTKLAGTRKGVLDTEQKNIQAISKAYEDFAENASPTDLERTYNTGDTRVKIGLIKAMNASGRHLTPAMINDSLRYGPTLDPDVEKTVKEFYPTYDNKIYTDPNNKAAGVKFDQVFKKFKDAKDPKNIHFEDFESVTHPGAFFSTKDVAFVMLATQLDRGDKNKIASDPELFIKYSKQIEEIDKYSDPEKNALFEGAAKNTGFTSEYIKNTFENLSDWNKNAAKWRSSSHKGGGGPTPPTSP